MCLTDGVPASTLDQHRTGPDREGGEMTVTQRSYTWRHSRRPADIKHPTSVAALLTLVRDATQERPILLRAGENALDVQALTTGTSVRTDLLPTDVGDPSIFRVWDDDEGGPGPGGTPASKLMRVAAWLPWRTILETAIRNEVLPYVTVSSGRITAGGSISGDGLSRFSPTVDKEAHHIYEMEVILPRWSNRITTLRHPDYFNPAKAPHPDIDEQANRDLFYSIVGGHGLIGVMTAVTYWVMTLRAGWNDPEKLRVRSYVVEYREHTDFFADLLGRFETARANRTLPPTHRQPTDDGGFFPRRPADGYTAYFGGGAINLGGRERAHAVELMTIWRSELDYDVDLDPFNGFSEASRSQLKVALRILPMARQALTGIVWDQTRKRAVDPDDQLGRPYVDDFFQYTFFFEQHSRAVDELLDEPVVVRPFKPGALQQTFAIPTDAKDADRFLDHAITEMNRALPDGLIGVVPQVIDALFLPQHESVLAPNPDGDAFAITLGFEGLGHDPEYAEACEKAMIALSRVCRAMGGKVHLTKNLYMDDDTLREMYGAQFERFRDIKQVADPNHVLRSDLWDRIERVMGW